MKKVSFIISYTNKEDEKKQKVEREKEKEKIY